MYEYGYTIAAGGEVREFALGVFDDGQYEQKRREVARANETERAPNIQGFQRPSCTRYWIRPVAAQPGDGA